MNRFLAAHPLSAALWIVASAGISACGSDGHQDTGTAVSFAGSWEGTWTAPAAEPSGVLALQLEQHGTTVTGTASFAGHPCLATCTVSCQVRDHEMSGWFDAGSNQMMFSGSCPESDHCSGSHHANTLTATYQIQDGPCAGESGVMQLTPVAAYEGNAPVVGAVYVGEVILIDQADGNVVRLPIIGLP